MKRFVKYVANGRIVCTGCCSDQDYEFQAGDGEYLLEGTADPFSQYVENGSVVSMPPRPDGFVAFDYTTKAWIPDLSEAENSVLDQRHRLLVSSDYTQLPDVPVTDREAWAVYRQALRDITEQPGYPLQINWPTAPGQE